MTPDHVEDENEDEDDGDAEANEENDHRNLFGGWHALSVEKNLQFCKI